VRGGGGDQKLPTIQVFRADQKQAEIFGGGTKDEVFAKVNQMLDAEFAK
jgi:hypothetical protein